MAEQAKRRATRKEVAMLAGVSPAMVSFVFDPDHKHPVKPSTRERIYEAAKELNYVPHFSGRSLHNQSSYNIALVLPERFAEAIDLFFLQVFHGICTAINPTDYQPIIFFGADKKFYRSLQSGRIDGIILLHYAAELPVEYNELADCDLPIAAVGFTPDNLKSSIVQVNLDYAGWVQHLLEVIQPASNITLIAPKAKALYSSIKLIENVRQLLPDECAVNVFDPLAASNNQNNAGSQCSVVSADLSSALPIFRQQLSQWHRQQTMPEKMICFSRALYEEVKDFFAKQKLEFSERNCQYLDPLPERHGQNLVSTELGKTAWQVLFDILQGKSVEHKKLLPYIE